MAVTEPAADPQTKVCPQCAEEVKAAALTCRFCRYEFEPLPDEPAPSATPVPQSTQPAPASSGTPDGAVPRSRADLAVELARTTQQWTLPQLLGKFDASRAGLVEIGLAAAVMREHGYEPGSPVYDEQGPTSVTYTRRPVQRSTAVAGLLTAHPPANKDTATRVGEMIGMLIGVGVIGVIIALVVAFFATGGLKSPASGTEGGTAGGTQQPGVAGDAWPPGFKGSVCFGALFELQDAGSHLGALADAAQNFDVARATDEAAAVNDRAQKAQAQLDALPAWAPASGLVADLRTAATSLRQGANLFQIAVKANDAEGVKQAASFIASGTSAITSATSEVSSLRSQYGFTCP